jgi:hypothetical protein
VDKGDTGALRDLAKPQQTRRTARERTPPGDDAHGKYTATRRGQWYIRTATPKNTNGRRSPRRPPQNAPPAERLIGRHLRLLLRGPLPRRP